MINELYIGPDFFEIKGIFWFFCLNWYNSYQLNNFVGYGVYFPWNIRNFRHEWHNIVIVRENSNAFAYIDGEIKISVSDAPIGPLNIEACVIGND